MTPEQIIAAYDRNPNLTLAALARRTGWSVKELKTLLLA
jgi:lambda repressor-like predicted transcriptional regulator